MHHDLAPDILDIVVVISVSPSRFVRLDLVLSEAATVFCGVFDNDSQNISAADIQFQSRSNQTFSTTTSVLLYDLRELVSYRVYCMTSTVDGEHDMALANILNTKKEVQLPCSSCNKSLSVDIHSQNVLVSDFMQNVFSIDFGDSSLLTEDVVARIDVTTLDSNDVAGARNCSSTAAVVSPQHITYASSLGTTNEAVDVLVGSLCAGRFQVNVVMYSAEDYLEYSASSTAGQNFSNAAINGIEVLYSNGRVFSMFSADSYFSDPEAIEASFRGSASEIEVTFDSDTDFADLANRVFDCSLLLSFPGASSTRCFWRDSSHLIVTLNSASTVLPGDHITVFSSLIGSSASNRNFTSQVSSSARKLSSSPFTESFSLSAPLVSSLSTSPSSEPSTSPSAEPSTSPSSEPSTAPSSGPFLSSGLSKTLFVTSGMPFQQ